MFRLSLILFLGIVLNSVSGNFGCRDSEKTAPPVKEKRDSLVKKVKEEQKMKIKIIFDNNRINKDFEEGWGFACLINDTILFDTGDKYEKIEKNIQLLDIDLDTINTVIISHDHYDHRGGLKGILENSKTTKKVYFCPDTKKSFIESIKKYNPEIILNDSYQKLAPFDFISAPFDGTYKNKPIKEQAYICQTQSGLVIVVGCAHPGIREMIDGIKAQFPGQALRLVIGGFHLFEDEDEYVKEIALELKEKGVENIAPCHCTGEKAMKIFREVYGSHYIDVRAGTELVL